MRDREEVIANAIAHAVAVVLIVIGAGLATVIAADGVHVPARYVPVQYGPHTVFPVQRPGFDTRRGRGTVFAAH
jgi:predicted membrane channel-forming protein YqfA (hemolysin III family)